MNHDQISKRQGVIIVLLFILTLFAYSKTNAAVYNPMVDSMKVELNNNGIKHVDIVLKQSIWESGWFNCKSCSWSRYNNPFGFRHKSWISETNPKGYIKFKNWRKSVEYYKNWQLKYYKGGDYYAFLLNIGYAEAGTRYIDNLKSIRL